MGKVIKNRKHIEKITASSICCLLIFLCSLLITGCPNPLIADIVEPKKITFETNGGSHVSSQTIFKGQQISRPQDPTRSEHNFAGWYRDNDTFANGWDFSAVPGGDMTLYAKWDAILKGPLLGGTASITGTYRIGQILSVNTSNITGSISGIFIYQWRSDGTNVGIGSPTYTIQGADAGKVITCVVTSLDAAGSITAGGQTVPYNLSINTTGLDFIDNVSFNALTIETEYSALGGTSVSIYYTLANPGTTTNRIILSFINTSMFSIDVAGSGNYSYIVNSGDATNGTISITATSTHTNLLTLDPPTSVTFGQSGVVSFNPGTNNAAAGGVSYTYTMYNSGVAVPGFTDIDILSGNIPAGIVLEMLDNAGAYTVSVKANTTNPAYDSPSIPVSSGAVNVYAVNVNIMGRIIPEYVTANTASGTANISFCVFSGGTVTLTAYPDISRYVMWSGDIASSSENSRTITNITGNVNITATFGNASLTVNLAPATTDVTFGSIAGSLTAAASVTPSDRTITYQWYSNNMNSNYGGTLISGNATATYAIPTGLAVGTHYYYCVVSADGVAAQTSNVAAVSVNPISITSVALTVVEPIGDQAPNYTASGTGDFSISDVSWFQGETIFSSGTFSSGTQYIVTITLSANPNYSFTGLSTATINVVDAARSNNTGTTIEISLGFIALPSLGEFTTIEAISAYLAAQPNGLTAEDPIYLHIALDDGLGIMTASSSNWQKLLDAIQDAGKYVALDLSNCVMNGTLFDPDRSVSTGKENIVSLVLPNDATSIPGGSSANASFSAFENLRSINGANVSAIDSYALIDCYNLAEVSFPAATSIGQAAFLFCSSLTDVSFPAATSIGDSAFYSCSNLADVSFPSVTSIGASAFSNCSSLTNVSFPAAISIGDSAFGHCSSLTNVSFPEATNIGDSAFFVCTNLADVSFPSVTSIDDSAFSSCSNLTSASFPSAVSISNNAFADTGNNPFTITLGASAPSLGTTIFSNVTRNVNVLLPNSATGYSPASDPFNGITVTVSGTDTTPNWGNGFRGLGWDGTNTIGTTIRANITVYIGLIP